MFQRMNRGIYAFLSNGLLFIINQQIPSLVLLLLNNTKDANLIVTVLMHVLEC